MEKYERKKKYLKNFSSHSLVYRLYSQSYRLFMEAYGLDNNVYLLSGMLLLAILLSLVKTKYIFTRSCRRNLARIEALKDPKTWQFYRVGFFLFLVTVISLGAYLSNVAHGNYWFLMGVGTFDMALSLALLFSSRVFWVE